jgi:putative selenium metabolism hydrolase
MMEKNLFTHETTDFLRELVKSCSYSGQEKGVAKIVLQKMEELCFDSAWQDEYGNVIGKRIGARPGPVIVFDAHMDVVPINNREEWEHDPFGAEVSQGKIWGRGTTDTKSSLAAIIMALGSLKPEDFNGTLYAVGSIGEEVLEGGGLSKILESVKPDFVIVGEPTNCRLAIGQKGRTRILFTAKGKSVHSSVPHTGENAMIKAGKMLEKLVSLPLPGDPHLGKGVMAPIQIQSKPFPSASTVPYECTIVSDRRLVFGETMANILDEYNQALSDLPGCCVEIDHVTYDTFTGKTISMPDFHPGWFMDPNNPWVKAASDGLTSAGIQPEIYTVPYCTNGSSSAGDMGIPTVIFGPSYIELAHVVDEYIDIEQLMKGFRGFVGLARRCSQV